MRFHPYRINAGIGSTTGRQILEGLAYIDLLIVQHGGLPLRFSHLQSLWNPINGNDLIRTEHIGAPNRKLTYRSTTPDGHGIAWLAVTIFCGHVAGGEDVRQKQDLLVP